MQRLTTQPGIKRNLKAEAFRNAHRAWLTSTDPRDSIFPLVGVQVPSQQLWRKRLGNEVAVTDRRLVRSLQRGKPMPTVLKGGPTRAQPCLSLLASGESDTAGLVLLSSKAIEWVPAGRNAGGSVFSNMVEAGSDLVVFNDVRELLLLQAHQLSGSDNPLPAIALVGDLRDPRKFEHVLSGRKRIVFWAEEASPAFWALAEACGALVSRTSIRTCLTPAAAFRKIWGNAEPGTPESVHLLLPGEESNEPLVIHVEKAVEYWQFTNRTGDPERLYTGRVQYLGHSWPFHKSSREMAKSPVSWAYGVARFMGHRPRGKAGADENRAASSKLRTMEADRRPGKPGIQPKTRELFLPGYRFLPGVGAVRDPLAVHPQYTSSFLDEEGDPMRIWEAWTESEHLATWAAIVAGVAYLVQDNTSQRRKLLRFRGTATEPGLAVCSALTVDYDEYPEPNLNKGGARHAPEAVCDALVAYGQGMAVQDQWETSSTVTPMGAVVRWWLDHAFHANRIYVGMSATELLDDLRLTIEQNGGVVPHGIQTRLLDSRSDGSRLFARFLAYLVGRGQVSIVAGAPREGNPASIWLISGGVFVPESVWSTRWAPDLPVGDDRVPSLMAAVGAAKETRVHGVPGLLFNQDWAGVLNHYLVDHGVRRTTTND